ncbi:MAG: formyltransferase family protein [Methanomassiliicoccales archaeon]|nr:formyltransferase family protein [Methanomassiliicoccales archaeon]
MAIKRIGWFTTGRGPGSLGLFTTMRSKIKSGEIDAQLAFVFLNREVKGNQYRAKLKVMAEEDGVPVIILPSDTFRPELKRKDLVAWRDAYGETLRESISGHKMDFGVLAGYMLILDPKTCQKYDIINLHPALPDTYQGTWEEIVRRVAAGDDEKYGSMVHVCTSELDRGAVVAYDKFDISDLRLTVGSIDELAKAIRAREAKREVPLLMETVKLLVNGDLTLKTGYVYDQQGRRAKNPISLASTIDSSSCK